MRHHQAVKENQNSKLALMERFPKKLKNQDGKQQWNDNKCEDIHLNGSQQCHELMGRSKGTKAMHGHSTRPVCKVMFSQSGLIIIMPDLNNILA